jgi:enterochelin esterase-like enzyme
MSGPMMEFQEEEALAEAAIAGATAGALAEIAAAEALPTAQPAFPLEQLPVPEWVPGQLHHLGPVEIPGFRPRTVRIYLPSSFRPDLFHPVLYGFDGQNLFEDEAAFSSGWHLHQEIENRVRRSRLAPIAVGIDHGMEGRIDELSPFSFPQSKGRADEFLGWMVGALIPYLLTHLPIYPAAEGALTAGSSMGGLAAFYAHLRFPEIFGGALAMSPSFWVADRAILSWAREHGAPPPSRIYLDGGKTEGEGSLAPILRDMAAALRRQGYRRDRLRLRIDPRGEHDEASWRRRLPGALSFFYGR